MLTCNTCESSNLEKLFDNSIKSTSRLKKVPHKVNICKDCGQVFLDYSSLSQKNLEDYYKINNPFEKVEELNSSHQNMRSEQVNFVLDNINKDYKNFKFLDIGCGSGYYLKLLKNKGLYCEGIERSNMMCDMINKHYDIKCTNTSFEELNLENKFDVVSIITVLEHLHNPKKCLLKINDLINSGGYLFIEVPDTQFPRSDILPDYLAFEHLHHWTKISLGNLLKLCGFEIVYSEQKRNDDDSGNPENVLRILAKKNNTLNKEITNDYFFQSKNLINFRNNHKKYIRSFKPKIQNILNKLKNNKLNIYCAGLHTSTLLSTFPEINNKILNIYDSDKNLKNTQIQNIPIKLSDSISEKENKYFLMSTTNHEHTIYDFLKSINKDFVVFGLYNDFD